MDNLAFRAWHKEQKRMIDVKGLCFKSNEIIEIHANELCGNEISFKDVELMQSTGFKDKNGNAIFIGDILQNEIGAKYSAEICGSSGAAVLVNRSGSGFISYYLGVVSDRVEIIGNIHENPELIK